MTELTDDNFEKEILNSSKPVLVDFFAVWCAPCSVLRPILEKISEDLEGKFIFFFFDHRAAKRRSLRRNYLISLMAP